MARLTKTDVIMMTKISKRSHTIMRRRGDKDNWHDNYDDNNYDDKDDE